jgi:hypothetical protein
MGQHRRAKPGDGRIDKEGTKSGRMETLGRVARGLGDQRRSSRINSTVSNRHGHKLTTSRDNFVQKID